MYAKIRVVITIERDCEMEEQEIAKIETQELSLTTKIAFNEFINSNPPTEWIKNHPTAKGVRYLPIDKVELILKKVFPSSKVEILDTKQMLNSIAVTVRVYYLHPVDNEWYSQDGVGAATIQVDKGENLTNLSAVKSNSIMLALPAAESYAIKDACEKIGNIFGANLNRKDTWGFDIGFGTDDEQKKDIAHKKAIMRKRLGV